MNYRIIAHVTNAHELPHRPEGDRVSTWIETMDDEPILDVAICINALHGLLMAGLHNVRRYEWPTNGISITRIPNGFVLLDGIADEIVTFIGLRID